MSTNPIAAITQFNSRSNGSNGKPYILIKIEFSFVIQVEIKLWGYLRLRCLHSGWFLKRRNSCVVFGLCGVFVELVAFSKIDEINWA